MWVSGDVVGEEVGVDFEAEFDGEGEEGEDLAFCYSQRGGKTFVGRGWPCHRDCRHCIRSRGRGIEMQKVKSWHHPLRFPTRYIDMVGRVYHP